MDDARHSTDDLNSLLPLLALELCLHDRLNHLTAEDIRLVEPTLEESAGLFKSPSIQLSQWNEGEGVERKNSIAPKKYRKSSRTYRSQSSRSSRIDSSRERR